MEYNFQSYINSVQSNPNNSNFYRDDYICKHFPELYKYLKEQSLPIKERLYLIINGLNERPCCEVCGNELSFKSISKGYKLCCNIQESDPTELLLNSTNSNQFREEYIKKHYPMFYKSILDNYPIEISWRERLYLKIHGMSEPQKCKCCNNYTKFINHTEGYLIYCSSKCANTDKDANEKRKQTCLENYGVENPLQSKEVREKAKQTTMERYGVEYVMQNEGHASKVFETIKRKHGGIGNASTSIKDKYLITMVEKYGVENPSQLECNKEKLRHNCPLNNPDTKEKAKLAKQKRIKTDFDDVIGFTSSCEFKNETGWICRCPHPECNKCVERTYVTYSQLYRDRLRDGSELCTKLLPFNISRNKNTTIELFIHNILDELDIEYETSNFKLIYPKELDIYIPSKKVAIECNGIYWHSSINKENSYHLNKYKTCEVEGIQLLTIWEDWIRTSPDLIKSMIWSKLGFYKERIGARQCAIKKVNAKESNKFLNENHIQGEVKGSVRYGLYYKGELISIMIFGKVRSRWELVRFSTKKYIQVIAGADRLFKRFIKDHNPNEIISFSCNDISKGNLYDKLGFNKGELNKSYWYVHKSFKRFHRSSFSKEEIVKRGWKVNIDNTWTEWEVMDNHSDEYLRIHDSGQTKWIWVRNKI